MKVKILNTPDELKTTAPAEINYLLWGTKSVPRTLVYLGFVPNDGFYLHMVCEEKDPRRVHTRHKSPVYQDSAIEAFLQFTPKKGYSNVYLNLEVNANGALLAGYGPSRTYRSYFTDADYKAFDCRASIEEDKWSVSLKLPVSILERVYGSLCLEKGDTFNCNFYKISETADIEHYASYSPILTSTPSFHMPEYFTSAVLD